MEWLGIVLGGYLLGSLNPAALIARIKGKNLRKNGTGNLGATNVLLNFGKRFGALVLLFDLAKAFFAVKLVGWIFPELALGGMVAGVSAVVGHVFPFYLGFRGGKGLAAYAGLVLAIHPWAFLFLLITGGVLMLLVNYSYILPLYSSVMVPIFVGLQTRRVVPTLLAIAVSVLIFAKHFGNLRKAIRGEDVRIREYIGQAVHNIKNKSK